MPHLYDSLLERLEGRQYQNYFSAFCPFDTHKSPALLVYEDGFVCLSCRKSGTLKYLDKFIGSHFHPTQRHDSVSRILPKWRKWEEQYGDVEGIVYEAHRFLKKHTKFQDYLKRRKIDDFIDEGYIGFMDSWITFPVYSSEHEILDVVVRSISRDNDTRYVVHPARADGLRPLYVPSWEKLNASEIVYVVFGIVDAISLHLSGLPSLTGITGKSLSADLLKPLRKRFVLLPDEGEEEEAHKLANSLGWRGRVKQLKYPEGTKDPDDVVRNFGSEKLIQMIGA